MAWGEVGLDGKAMREAIDKKVREVGDAIERACEQSIQEGRNGVLVVKTNGEWQVFASHPDVPYGAIYERNAPDE